MKEEWERLELDNIPKGTYELDEINYNFEGLTLILTSEYNKISVKFSVGVVNFRTGDKSDRWKTLDTISFSKGDGFFSDHIFFKISNSLYEDWIIEDSFGTLPKNLLTHYVILTNNDMTDILSAVEPIIEVSKK